MSNALPIEDLSKTYLEHSMVSITLLSRSAAKSKTAYVVSLVMVFSMNGVKMMIK